MKRHFLWVTDSWDSLDHPRDTTLRLIEESVALGFKTYWCDVATICLKTNDVWLKALEVQKVLPGRNAQAFHLSAPKWMRPREFAKIIYRPDPPIDLSYLQPLQLLVLGTKTKITEIINPPEVLFGAGEKLEGARLGNLMPPTLVSSQWDNLLDFGKTKGITVLKPLHQAQSKGVELLNWRTTADIRHAKAVLSRESNQFQRPVLLQSYISKITQGEQRLWFLNGKLLAWARKLPRTGEFRINMDQGATLSASRLSLKEKQAALKIGKLLQNRNIRLAAVDLIGGYVTDFNFTSPGLLSQIESITQTNLAGPIILSLKAASAQTVACCLQSKKGKN